MAWLSGYLLVGLVGREHELGDALVRHAHVEAFDLVLLARLSDGIEEVVVMLVVVNGVWARDECTVMLLSKTEDGTCDAV